MKPSRIRLALLAAAVVAGAYFAWHWMVERVEVPPGHILVRIHLWGKPLPDGEILAPDESYQGIQKEVLTEGRHFRNPLVWATELREILDVPAGQCAVLTRRYGHTLPADRVIQGNLLVEWHPASPDQEYRGIVRDVLTQGRHHVNPYAYEVKLVNAVEIKTEQVGVRTVKVGLDERVLKLDPDQSPYVVPVGKPEGVYRGVQEKPVAAGTYYINPYAEDIVPVDVRSHRVEFVDIEFPSKDGFTLKPQVFVTFRVDPARAPELFVTLTEAGTLDQTDSAVAGNNNPAPHRNASLMFEKNQILRKIVLPQIRGYVRIEGSKFDARDFIAAATAQTATPAALPAGVKPPQQFNPRERLQQLLMEKVAPRCLKAGVVIESITIAQMDVPQDLAEQISQRELARVIREKNADKIGQYKTEQELKATEGLKQQSQEVVDAQTRMVQAKTRAEQRKAVEEARLEQDLENARLRLESAKKQAEAQLASGKAEADVTRLRNEAEVAGLRQAVGGFNSPDQYAQYMVLKRLAPALGEVFATDGSDFAKLFTAYLTPSAAATEKKATAPATATVQDEKKPAGGQ